MTETRGRSPWRLRSELLLEGSTAMVEPLGEADQDDDEADGDADDHHDWSKR